MRSVDDPLGGTVDYVVVGERRKRDEAHYLAAANAVCGERATCMVFFWADASRASSSGDMSVGELAAVTATYERHPDYPAPVLHLACWLYPDQEVAERARCTYLPGAKVPWK